MNVSAWKDGWATAAGCDAISDRSLERTYPNIKDRRDYKKGYSAGLRARAAAFRKINKHGGSKKKVRWCDESA